MPTPIIVVHNDDKTRELATNALRDTGYEVAAFNNPMRALDAMDGSTRIRVLVTRVDFGPGTLNGVALARMVTHKQPTTKVVFVALEENREHTADLGEFLPVPLDPKALVDAVIRSLKQRSQVILRNQDRNARIGCCSASAGVGSGSVL